jgi:hypothetical protein
LVICYTYALMKRHNTPIIPTIDASAKQLPAALSSAYHQSNRREAADYGWHYQQQLPHIGRSQQRISEAAQLALAATPRNEPQALVLGIGNGIGVPLEHIADSFSKTTVVDIDKQTALRTVRQLPSTLQGKIRIIQAELTNTARQLSVTAQKARRTSDTYEQYGAYMTPFINALGVSEAEPQINKGYDLVCSQLLLSRLVDVPLHHIEHQARERYKQPLQYPPLPTDESYNTVRQGFTERVQAKHIWYLRSVVAAAGVVCLQDTRTQTIGTEDEPYELPLMHEQVVEPAIAKTFVPVDGMQSWEYTPNPSTRYSVISTLLRPAPKPYDS